MHGERRGKSHSSYRENPRSCRARRANHFPARTVSRRIFLPQGRRRTLQSFGSSARRSEEHTSELQSLTNLVCRLLLEKKKKKIKQTKNKNKHHMMYRDTIL